MSFLRKTDHQTEHRYVEERLSAYLDGEVTPKERAAIDRHLETCRACRLNLETLRQTVRWTRGLKPVPVPRMFTIPATARPARTARPIFALPVLRAATVVAALLLFFAFATDYVLTGLTPQRAAAPIVAMQKEPASTQPGEGNAQTLQAPAPGGPASGAAPAEPPMAKAAPAMPTAEAGLGSQGVVATVLVERSAASTAESEGTPAPPAMALLAPEGTPTPVAVGLGGGEPITVTEPATEEMSVAGIAPSPSTEPAATTGLSAAIAVTELITATQLMSTAVLTPTPSATGGLIASFTTSTISSSLVVVTPSATPEETATQKPPATATRLVSPATATPRPKPTRVPVARATEAPTAEPPSMAADTAVQTEMPQPTVVAAMPQLVERQAAHAGEQEQAQERGQAVKRGLRLAEVGLGAAVGLLAVATIVLALRQRSRLR